MKEIICIEGIRIPTGSHEGKEIIIGSDHREFYYKQAIIEMFKSKNYSLIDVGTFSSEKCDYPKISNEIAKKISENKDYNKIGIGICGSGIGMLIPASKFRGVYIARCLNPKEAETSRKHNNTNLLGIGADSIDLETALTTVDTWLKTSFYSDPEKEESYLRRFIQTVKIENEIFKNINN